MKTKEELNALKNEVEAMNAKLAELTEEELKDAVGGYEDLKTHNGVDILGQATKQARLPNWDLIFRNTDEEKSS